MAAQDAENNMSHKTYCKMLNYICKLFVYISHFSVVNIKSCFIWHANTSYCNITGERLRCLCSEYTKIVFHYTENSRHFKNIPMTFLEGTIHLFNTFRTSHLYSITSIGHLTTIGFIIVNKKWFYRKQWNLMPTAVLQTFNIIENSFNVFWLYLLSLHKLYLHKSQQVSVTRNS